MSKLGPGGIRGVWIGEEKGSELKREGAALEKIPALPARGVTNL